MADLQSNKVQMSRHVLFLEHIFPFATSRHNDNHSNVFHDLVLLALLAVEQTASFPLNKASNVHVDSTYESFRPQRVTKAHAYLSDCYYYLTN